MDTLERSYKSHKQTVVASQFNKEREYWLNKLSGELTKTAFPYDYRKKSGESRLETFQFQWTGDLFLKLMKLSNNSDQRLHMILVAALTALIHRYTFNTDIILGAPALKQETDAEFINTVLVLRNTFDRQITYKELLLQVRNTIIEATGHLNYPVETLPDQLNISNPETDGFPLFDIAVMVENIHDKKYIQHFDLKIIFSFLRSRDQIDGTVTFDALVYNARTIKRIVHHFRSLLEVVLEDVNLRLTEVEMLSREERHKLLVEFNNTEVGYSHPLDKTIHELFIEQTKTTPDHIAIVGAQGAVPFNDIYLTYRELNKKSGQLAQVLKERGVGADTIVGLMLERSVEMVIGMLGILKAGGAYLPIDINYPQKRIDFMLKDSHAALLLTSEELSDMGRGTRFCAPTTRNLHLSLAYVIYTSGSTGRPKGVAVAHRGLVNLVYNHRIVFGEDSCSRVSQVASPGFDAMASEVWPCLSSGSALYFADDETRVDPARMKAWLIKNRITISYQPTILAEQLLKEEWPMEGVALRVLRAAGDRLTQYPKSRYPFRLYNLYGPTEDTVWTTWTEVETGVEVSGMPTIGKPIGNHQVYIFSPGFQLQPVGIPGELCISGIGLARGYLNNPELTAEKFRRAVIGHLSLVISSSKSTNDQCPMTNDRLYRTGDLARWLEGGDIEFLGRIDHQVKIRGFRIELGEIEDQLLKHKDIENAVVMVKESEQGAKNLFAFIVTKKKLNVTEIRDFLLVTLPDYMVPAYFVELDRIPLSPNGKIDRMKLLEMNRHIKFEVEYRAPRSSTEKKLVEIWKNLLELEQVGIKDNFFIIGGDSIKTISLLSAVNEEFNTSFKVVDLYENETIEKIAARIAKSRKEDMDELSIEVREEFEALKSLIIAENNLSREDIEDIYPLSDIEKGMIFYSLKDPSACIYHNQVVFQVKHRDFNARRLKQAIGLMVRKHPILRTGFSMYNFEEPVHIVYKYREEYIDFQHDDISHLGKKRQEEYIESLLAKDRREPFSFDGLQPVWRMKTVGLDEENICFLWICHHAMIDGWGSASLMTELNNTYLELKTDENIVLQQLKSSYKDFVIQEIDRKKRGETSDFWKNELDGYRRFEFPGVVDEHVESSRRRSGSYPLGVELLDKLKRTAGKYDSSVKDLCFAAYIYMLSMLCYDNDIVVGLITNNRPVCADGEKIIGCFLNTVPVRLNIPVNIKWEDFIYLVSEKLLELKRYDKLSLFEIVRVLGEQTQGANPVTDTIFNYVDFHVYDHLKGKEFPAAPLSVQGSSETNTLFDFTVDVSGGGFEISSTYSSSLLDDEQFRRLCGYFERVLNKFISEAETVIGKDQLMWLEEKRALLYEFNNTRTPYPAGRTIPELFEEQAEKRPDIVALIGVEPIQISYGELNKKADQLAHLLRGKGVKPETIVGLLVDRSLEMIIGIMGILKAGGAYLPIDPSYPQERIDFMLKDSGAKILLTDLPEGPHLHHSSFITHHSACLAYIIYTSGTTGKPKGTLTAHYNVTRVVRDTNYIDINPEDRVLQLSNYAFDGSVFDIFAALLNGAALVLLAGEKGATVERLAEVIQTEKITVFFVTTALFNLLADERPDVFSHIRKVLFGGERISVEHTRRALEYAGPNKLIHMYGPTETTVYATFYFIDEIHQQLGTLPIGKPLSNTLVYILDNHLTPVPPGVVGELYIGGYGTARGYLNHQELTADKFMVNPFVKGDRMYKTGDLCSRLPDGNIIFRSRIDHQVKIRGFRVEPGEIESRLSAHKDIKEALVESRWNANGDHYLCTYVVLANEVVLDETTSIRESLRAYLSRSLPNYMIPSYFMVLDEMPLTPNGKVDRGALPLPQISAGENYTAPGNEAEEKLTALWSEILGIEKKIIGIDASFFELGGHSLKITKLAAKIHQVFDVKIPLAEIFASPTIRELTRYIQSSEKVRSEPIEAVEEKEFYPLSSMQKRLYTLQQMDETSTAYNIPAAAELEGPLAVEKMKRAFFRLIRRHESLRTAFELIEEEPKQKILADVEFEIDYRCAVIQDFIRSFDLSKAPLLRVGLIEIDKQKHLLMVDMHHIISDGVSIGIFLKEFMAFYGEETLPEIRIHYNDFSHWHNHLFAFGKIQSQEGYWLREFAGEIPVLNLPTDFPRPQVQSFEGSSIRFEIDGMDMERLNQLAAKEEATLYTVLLAIFNIMLSKVSGQDEIVVGTAVAGRKHAEFQQVIGMFVNTLALKNVPQGHKTFRQFLEEVKQKTLAALENQDYPFEELVDNVDAVRDTSRNPIFDVMMVLENIDMPELKLGGLKLKPYEFESRISKFDLTMIAMETADGLSVVLEYCTKLSRTSTIEGFFQYFKAILKTVLGNADIKIGEIEILPDEDKRRILEEFNDTSVEFPGDKTIHELFEEQVEKTSDSIAVVGAHELHELHEISITYGELNRKSNQLAHLLLANGVGNDTIVAVMLERSVEMVIALLGILKAGGAYLPIDPENPEERKQYMLADSGAGILLTDLSEGHHFHHSSLITHHSGNLAYVIYTSGTTGTPKGVLIRHRGVINLVYCHRNVFGEAPGERVSQVASPGFDAMAAAVWPCLLSGATLYIAENEIRANPVEMRKWLIKKRITISFQPTVMAEELLEEEWPEQGAALRVLRTAGDRLKKYPNRSYPFRFYNLYGPTEDTVWTTWKEVKKKVEEDIKNYPTIGKPVDNHRVYILSSDLMLQPVGVAGELCIAGEGLAMGYLNNPELTAEKFVSVIYWSYKSYRTYIPSRIYKTGDLARWLADGDIEFLGRIDYQVKIRGFRIELGEIESHLLKHGAIDKAAVIDRETRRGEKYLCAYMAPKSGLKAPDSTQLREYLSQRLPAYMLPSYFVTLECIPVTPNGKVDRKALPEPELKTGEKHLAPANAIEETLVSIWSEILSISPEAISTDANFFELGGHSLKATVMISMIHRQLDVKVPLAELFITPTIRGLSLYIQSIAKIRYNFIRPAEEKKFYPLSSMQKRLYILQQMDKKSTGYNLPTVALLEGTPDIRKMERVFFQLIQRHESLRTAFESIEGEPVQKILAVLEFEIEYPCAVIQDFIRPFQLSKAPLLRAGLLEIDNQKHLLMADMHHIISDGVSIGIFLKEFMALYGEEALPEITIHYKDFSQWHNQLFATGKIKKQEEYWVREFAEEIPVLNLPLDFTRPRVQSSEGSSFQFEISHNDTAYLNQLAAKEEATLYMVLLAMFNIMLSKVSSQDEIVIGTAVAGRRSAELHQTIGMFVNTLALKNFPLGYKTFRQFLEEVKQKTLAALENQDYPFEELVEQVNVTRDTSRNPLFDVMFVLENIDLPELELAGLKLKPYEFENRTAKFDLTMISMETEDGLSVVLEYCTQLFRPDTIERYSQYFKSILAAVLENPGIKIGTIEIISDEDKRRILEEFNNTYAEFPMDKTIHELFENQVEKTPDGVAVIGMAQIVGAQHAVPLNNNQLTYGELNKKSNQLAHLLKEKGVLANDIVGITVERSVEMIIGILAILKAGGAYLPIAPEYPRELIDYMLKDSAAKMLLTNLPEGHHLHHSSIIIHHPGTLAYVIYTSGTTGRPKAVIVEHRGVVRLVKNTDYIKFKAGERLLQTGALEFDASTFEIWGSLLNGMTLYEVEKETILSTHKLKSFIRTNHITTIWLTSPLFNRVCQDDVEVFAGLKYLLVGGDVLSPVHIDKVRERYPELVMINGYGPTENTTFSTTFRIDRLYNSEKKTIPIGGPIVNSTAYIVDGNHNLQPLGVVGELWVGGEGVARGYLNNPELTAEKFLSFRNRSYKSYRTYISKKIYKTGDLARWLPDGNIEFLGRRDHQVKIRGFRIELGEIEIRLLNHDHIDEVVVIDRENEGGEKYLCAYLVLKSALETEAPGASELREYLSRYLPGYMVPSYFVPLEHIPLTPNGKVDRGALPEPELKTGEKHLTPANKVEKTLASIWSGILSLPREVISTDANFFELGGHSLKATTLAAKTYQVFQVKLPLEEIFVSPTIRGLARYIQSTEKIHCQFIAVAEKKEYYPLSSMQKRLFILQQMDKTNTGYNMPAVVELEGTPGIRKMKKVFYQLIQRHESLRTAFEMIEGEPMQKISADVEFEIEYPGAVIRDFIRPFDLSRAPLLRVGLLEIDNQKHLLMIDMHHIIADGISVGIFLKEFTALYGEEALPAIAIHYKDFSQWHNRLAAAGTIKKQEEYWLREFAEEIPVLNLPLDFPRPPVQGFAGSSIHFEVNPTDTARLNRLAAREETTLYMLLMALFNIMLSKVCNQDEIVVGTAAAGRGNAELRQTIGMFVNTLAIKNSPQNDKTFGQFLEEVKQKTLAALENQDYPFEELVEQVDVTRDTSRNPLFDVMFVLENIDLPELELEGLKLKPYEFENRIAKFDLTMTAAETAGGLRVVLEYRTKLFKESTIEGFRQYFSSTLRSVLDNPGIKIGTIEIISGADKRRIMEEFNNTFTGFPIEKTIHELFAEQVGKTPEKIAVVGKKDKIHVTYGVLNEKAGLLAHLLREKGAGPGTIAAIKVERSIELIIGLLGILKAGGAYLPIDPEYPEERSDYILKDSNTALLLTSGELSDVGRGTRFCAPTTCNLHLSLAYVIYTSGTTGTPKGVLIRHRGFINLIRFHRKIFGENHESRVSQAASPGFDAMAFEVWPCLVSGASLYIADNEIRANPARMKEWIIENGITISFQPTMMAEALLEEEWPERGAALRVLRTAGDRLKKYPQRPYPFRFYNLYGPTEDTVWTTWTEVETKNETDTEGYPTIGKPIDNHRVHILSSGLMLQPIGAAGELCIAGEGLAVGYLNNPELTAEKFDHDLWDFRDSHDEKKKGNYQKFFGGSRGAILQKSPPGRRRLYKTGDLARWLPGGNIEFLGRIDHQVKIRGFRIELGEIESLFLKHGSIDKAAVIARETESGEKHLCAYIVPKPGSKAPGPSQLREYLSQRSPAYMIPSYFVTLERLPLTTSGKVDRKALPEPVMKKGETLPVPANEIEAALVTIWSDILSLPPEVIGTDANFFELGGHSLKATLLVTKIYREFQVEIPLEEVFASPTIRTLAHYIQSSEIVRYNFIEIAEEKEFYPLSSMQKRLYVLQQMDKTNTGYNMPAVVELEGTPDIRKMKKVFYQLIQRHESLRTAFKLIEGEPKQKISADVEFEIEYPGAVIRDFIRPFDLSGAPLLRVGLLEIDNQKHLLMADMHHIISDGISIGIFLKEFTALYGEETLPAIAIHYKDFSQWHNRLAAAGKIKKQEEYWLREFAEEIPVLNLPLDFPRPPVQSFAGSSIHFEVNPTDTARLHRLAAREEVTLYMVLLAAFTITLSKISGQDEVIVGTAAAGRRNAELRQAIGMFVNTLAIKNSPQNYKTFNRFLEEVKQKTLAALENQDYPFEELVEQVDVTRDTSRNPLFDVMFVLENIGLPELELEGLKLKPYEFENRIAKFDLTMTAAETTGGLHVVLEYCTRLFKESTIERLFQYFSAILRSVLENPGIKIGTIEIISDEDKRRILEEFNNTYAEFPMDKTIHELFENQVEKTPDGVAVIGMAQIVGAQHAVPLNNNQLTYGELNKKSNQLARLLIEKGVLADNIVGIMVNRSIEMIIGIWGILKAGGAYLPIDPEYPQERIDYMLKDSNAALLLTSEELSDVGRGTKFCAPTTCNLNLSLAYIIYTSGTTGWPRGTLIEHRSLVNLCSWHNHYYGVTGRDHATQYAGTGFDASVWEIFPYLVKGAAIHIIDESIKLDIELLNDYYTQHNITISFLPTQLCEQFMGRDNKSLRVLLTGGDKLRRFVKRDYDLYNNYGPTENTVVTTAFALDKPYHNIPIGTPIYNNRIFILAAYDLKPQPIGVCGELCITGSSLARGYLNNPELTAERFINFLEQASLFPTLYSPTQLLTHSTIYRTGDLVRWLEDGNIEFLGRIDYQVKIRGFRIEIGEIEKQLSGIGVVKEAAVIDREEESGQKYLCAYVVLTEPWDLSEIKDILSRTLPGYMIPAYFVELAAIPLTAGGKVDKNSLPLPETVTAEEYRAPRNEIEEKLAVIWSKVLGLEKEKISMTADFFQLGGHSLKAAIMTAKIHEELNAKIPLPEIFRRPTIRGLSDYIQKSGEEQFISIKPVEEKDFYSLSPAQKRLYILQHMQKNNLSYNMPHMFMLEGNLNRERFEETFRKLMRRHENLRTSFKMIKEQPIQKVHRYVDFAVEYDEPNEDEVDELLHSFLKPFDLANAPLLRVKSAAIGAARSVLFFDMHHIIMDGTSMGILMREFMALYADEDLPPLRIQYKDFSRWQHKKVETGEINRQEEYWLKEFAGDVPVLNLPVDYKRPEIMHSSGGAVEFEISAEETKQLKQMALQEGTTLYMVLLAIFNVLLSRVCDQDDILVGVPTAGRRHVDLQSILGFFINMLAVRNLPGGEKTFREFLQEVKSKTLNAYENQDYQFENLVEKILADRGAGRNSLVDVIFVFQNMAVMGKDIPEVTIPDLVLKPYEQDITFSPFDLLLNGGEIGEIISLSFQYRDELFKKETIQLIIRIFNEIISSILEDKYIKLKDIRVSYDLIAVTRDHLEEIEGDLDFFDE